MISEPGENAADHNFTENEITSLPELGDPLWLKDAAYGGIRIVFYVSEHASLTPETAKAVVRAAKSSANHPVVATLIRLDAPMEYVKTTRDVSRDDSGKLSLSVTTAPATITTGHYAVLLSPFHALPDNGMDMLRCSEALDAARGCLLTLLGDSIAEEQTADFTVRSSSPDKLESSCFFIARTTIADYRFISDQDMTELGDYIASEKDPLWRNRYETAFSFMGRARMHHDSRLRFFEMWTALEVFCGGYSSLAGRINRQRDSAPRWYEVMNGLKCKRRNIVHEGGRPSIDAVEEKILSATLVLYMLERAKINTCQMAKGLMI